MRVISEQVAGQGNLNIKPREGGFTNALKEGDSIKAMVLSSDNSVVVMKTKDGHVFKARFDANTKLLPGDVLQLEVSAKEKGNVSLSIVGDGEDSNEIRDDAVGQQGVVRELSDKSLAPYTSKLAELKMPVSEETARLMRELMAQNPGMTLDEAAFLASNKLTGDENLIKAALALLSNGDKTNAILTSLIELLNQSESMLPEQSESGIRNPEVTAKAGQTVQDLVSTVSVPGGASGAPVESAPLNPASLNTYSVFTQVPLSDWLLQFAESATGDRGMEFAASQSTLSADVLESGIGGQALNPITTPDMVTPVLSNGGLSHNSLLTDFAAIPTGGATGAPEVSGQPKTSGFATQPIITQSDSIMQSTNVEKNDEISQNSVTSAVQSALEQQKTVNPKSEGRVSNSPSMGRAIAELLSEIPEFRATPTSALERFSNMLLRVAGNEDGKSSDNDKLTTLLDKLFTRIEKGDNNGGERLRKAREELYARLALIEEEISLASPPAKAQMLEQTRRLMNHVRLLNNIDQFVYMQLPVQMGEERKTAELYLFKRKGGKRADPDNVNILLALELENMGHWEALINFRDKDVSIQMEVPGEKEKQHFSDKTVMLHEMLAEAGFKLVNTEIKYSKKETTPLTALSSFNRYTSGHAGIIDYMI